MLYRYKVILEWDEEGKGYVVSVPALPGCFTQGDTVEEALERAKEAIAGHLAALAQEGLPLPTKDVAPGGCQQLDIGTTEGLH